MPSNFYDKSASRKQEITALTDDMVRQREVLFDALGLKAGERLLEVGSGNGIFCQEAWERMAQSGAIVGVDYSEDMVEMAASRCPHAEFLQADACHLPTADHQFDATVLAQVLCFVDDVEKAVSELYRTLKPGGRLVILDTDWDSLVWPCEDRALYEKLLEWIVRPYTSSHVPSVLSGILKRAGFEITGRFAHPIVNWELNQDNYSGQLVAYFSTMAEDDGPQHLSALNHWVSDLEARSKRGEYLFSLCRYVFCAQK